MPGAEGRPSGPRFGTLVHAVLAIVPLDAGEEVDPPDGGDAGADPRCRPTEEVVAATAVVDVGPAARADGRARACRRACGARRRSHGRRRTEC